MSVSEEEANLNTYKIQLQQVEAALTNDPENEELKKLKVDLGEVIALTQDLIDQATEAKKAQGARAGGGGGGKEPKKRRLEDEIAEDAEMFDDLFREINWRPGMQCYAPWTGDGKLNLAKIVEVAGDNLTATVAFEGYNITEKCTVSNIKHPMQVSDWVKTRSKRNVMQHITEKKKKKTINRMQKLKELDEVKEREKKSWKSFMGKSNKKGINKKSIFRSSDDNKVESNYNSYTGGDCPLSKGMSSRF